MSKTKMPISVEESTRGSRSRHKVASVPQLPPLSINAMTPVQLQEFVPALMKVVMGDYSSTRSLVHRPHWWPPDVPLWSGAGDRNKEGSFSEAMRKVVRNCYHHLGQEALLSAGKLNDWRTLIGRAQTRKQTLASGDAGSVSDSLELTKSVKPFVEIYVCFFCSKEFSAKEDMRTHQLGCTQRPQELQSLDTPPPATKRNRPQIKPLTPVPAEKSPDSSPSMEQFLHKFHLIPVSKAKRLRASTRKNTEVDCSKIDFSEPETPISPTTPKTPKLLISQLSRDDSGHCKRRLSYRLHEDQSDSESVVSGSSEDTEEKQAPTRNRSLLSIDVSSLLGQRLQKHLKSDTNVCVVANAEAFCKTPVKNHFLEKLRKKENTFPITFKPRKKTKKRPHVHLYSFTRRQRLNQYKRLRTGLNKRSRILARSMPNCRVVLGKLTKQSLKYWESRQERELSKIPCIFPEGPTFLSEDIDKMLGLRKKNGAPIPERSLSLTNIVSEDTNAEVLQQKVAVYRSLLSDLSSSKEQSLISISPNKAAKISMSLLQDDMETTQLRERFPQLNTLLQTGSNNPPIPGEPLTPSSSTSSSPDSSQLSKQSLCQPLKIDIPVQASLRKNNFRRSLSACSSHGDVPRECMSPDDSVSIVTVSSDEDSFNALCCAGCRERQKCKCSPVKVDVDTGADIKTKIISRTRNAHGQFLPKVKMEQQLVPEKKCKGIKTASDEDEKKCQLPGKKSKDVSSVSQDKMKTERLPEEKMKTKEISNPKDKKTKEISVVEEKKKTKEQSLSEVQKRKKDLSMVEGKKKTKVQTVQEDKKRKIRQSILMKKKIAKENSLLGYKKKIKEKSALEHKKKRKELPNLQKRKMEQLFKKKSKLSMPEDKKKARKLYGAQVKKKTKELPESKKKTKEVPLPEGKKKAKEHSVPEEERKPKESFIAGEKKKVKESTVQRDKKKSRHPVSENRGETTVNKKSKENKSVAADRKTKELSALAENRKSKNLKMFVSSTGQYGLRRQASAPEGLDKTHSQSPVKSCESPVKRPSKLGLRSYNFTSTNSPVRGLKRQASCSPTKSAMPSPKKSRTDLIPRKRSNSVLI